MIYKSSNVGAYIFSKQFLEELPTLSVGQADDLKMDFKSARIWLSRVTKEDGALFDNMVTVEELIDGRWETIMTYEAE